MPAKRPASETPEARVVRLGKLLKGYAGKSKLSSDSIRKATRTLGKLKDATASGGFEKLLKESKIVDQHQHQHQHHQQKHEAAELIANWSNDIELMEQQRQELNMRQRQELSNSSFSAAGIFGGGFGSAVRGRTGGHTPAGNKAGRGKAGGGGGSSAFSAQKRRAQSGAHPPAMAGCSGTSTGRGDTTSSALDAGECAAWQDGYDRMDGPNWYHCSDKRNDPCGCNYADISMHVWYVTCTNGVITVVYLYNNRLSGPLPASWAAMTQMQRLYLGANSLTGTVPQSWVAMTQLRYLGLESNSFDVDYGFYDNDQPAAGATRGSVIEAICPPGTTVNAAQNGCTPCGKGQTDILQRTACLPCADPSWCLGGTGSSSTTDCIASRTGVGCSECADGYAQYQSTCTRCPDNSGALVVPVVVLVLVGYFVLRKLSAATDGAIRRALDKGSGSMAQMQQVAALMTLFTLVQSAGTLVAIDFGWPIDVRWFSSIIDRIASLDITGAAAPECTVTMDPFQRWLLTLFVPLIPLIVLGLLIGCVKTARRCCRCACCHEHWINAMDRWASWLNNKALGIFLVTYILIARSAMSPFDCVESGSGTSYMRDMPDMECRFGARSSSKQHFTYSLLFGLGIGAVVACCLAIVIVACELRSVRTKLHTDERTMHEYGSLYLRYDEKHYYWEVLILIRKLLLVVILRVLSNHQWAQVAGCAVVFGGGLVLQHWRKPFLSDALDQLEERTLVACMGIVLLGMGSLLGLPPLAVTALYFALVAASAVYIGLAVRAVWREEKGKTDEGGHGLDGALGKHQLSVTRVPKKRLVV
eukprot:g1563.t1